MRVVRFTVIMARNGKRLESPPLTEPDAAAWRFDHEAEGWAYIATKAQITEIKP